MRNCHWPGRDGGKDGTTERLLRPEPSVTNEEKTVLSWCVLHTYGSLDMQLN